MMNDTYQAKIIESNLQKSWQEKQSFSVCEDPNKEKFYCLSQFPYPSGKLHMGHVRVYTIGDVIARQQRKLGKNVLQPMGWDAFGLPAENAAIKNNVAPAEWTYKNIAQMRDQLKRLGCAYDWSREIASCHPEYYHWEQWLFIKMLEKGWVYRKNSVVNWDPVDQTVLANEQVIDGRGWRSGALVEQREIPQWFLKITDYADELIDELDNLPGWPHQVKTMQKNWIGRSTGVIVEFALQQSKEFLTVFTTRPDTLYGVTYLAISPTHPLALHASKDNADVNAFIESCKYVKAAEADMAVQEKRGIDTGLKAINPLTQQTMPIWIANFVLADYGPGAVMSVPGHDQRDFEFAQKYQLPIKQVIQPDNNVRHDFNQSAFTGTGQLINSDDYNGVDNETAKQVLTDKLVAMGQATAHTNYRLRDWGISRQRYWGAPIPVIYCQHCGAVPVPEKDLPVLLPLDVTITGSGSPLASMPEFYETTCPTCKKPAKRETDTFDTFFESSWYFMRFACRNLQTAMIDDRAKYWMSVDAYVGGIEHAVLHLLYSRFLYKVMRDLHIVNNNEPFLKLIPQGMVLKDGAKMSKSKGNVVDPDELIEKYGADTIRFFIIFAAPPEQSLEWSDAGVDGSHRFLKKLWAFVHEHLGLLHTENLANKDNAHVLDWTKASTETQADRREIYALLQLAQFDYERLQLNTVASTCMKLLNHLQALAKKLAGDDKLHYQSLILTATQILLSVLNPITPHITQTLWEAANFPGNIIESPWPKVNKAALQTTTVDIGVQINGKQRARIQVPTNADQATIEKIACADEKVMPHLHNKTIKKIIVVPNKLVNLLTGDQ